MIWNLTLTNVEPLSCMICLYVSERLIIKSVYQPTKSSVNAFLNGYLAIIDCSRQNESNQEQYRGYAIRIWIQRECIREYYRLLSHLTRSHVRIQPVVQCSVQDHINYDICKCFHFLNIRDITKKSKCFTTEHTLEELFVMIVPTFVDL